MSILAHRAKSRLGFTLVELLLTVVLVMLLAGAVVFNVDSLQRGAELDEGAAQFEALLHFAQAHAATTGRKVTLEFYASSTNALPDAGRSPRLVWEPNPLELPGTTELVNEVAPLLRGIDEWVEIREVHLLGTGTSPVAAAEVLRTPPEVVLEPTPSVEPTSVHFYPDGSCESADIVLAARSGREARELVVHLDGITGRIERRAKVSSLGAMDPVPAEAMERGSAEQPEVVR